jgi:hypothetical protein
MTHTATTTASRHVTPIYRPLEARKADKVVRHPTRPSCCAWGFIRHATAHLVSLVGRWRHSPDLKVGGWWALQCGGADDKATNLANAAQVVAKAAATHRTSPSAAVPLLLCFPEVLPPPIVISSFIFHLLLHIFDILSHTAVLDGLQRGRRPAP